MRGVWAAIIICVAALEMLPSAAQAADRIEWRLENPFRLFKKPEHTNLHRAAYASLTGSEKHTPILAEERLLAAKFGGRGWAEQVFNDTCYHQDKDRYTACANYVLPKTHRILAKLAEQKPFWDFFNRAGTQSPRCKWLLEDLRGKALASQTANCDTNIGFDIPYPAGARLTVSRIGSGAKVAKLIKIEDLLIVGLGDSFGAGEGNPDDPVHFNDQRSTDYGTVELAATGVKIGLKGYPARRGKWSNLSGTTFRNERARWWDRECHRSLYSHQLRAALQLAVENPQRAITFLSFSCSGAEVLQGLLLSTPVRECTPGEPASVPSQLSALSQELCTSVTNARMPAAIVQRVPEMRAYSEASMRIKRCGTIRQGGRTRPALKRPIDMIFLSVGGNDVGFVPVVADSILDQNSVYRRLGSRLDSVYGPDRARQRMALLRKRLDGLKYALSLFLDAGHDTKVIYTGYPNLGYDADGANLCGGTKGMEVFPPFRLDAAKVGEAETFSRELNGALSKFAGTDWTFVDGFSSAFRSHGLCATKDDSPAEALSLPIFDNGVWEPYQPSLFPAYTERQRWFRTPNDAFMTAHMHARTVSSFGANCSRVYTGALRTLARRHWKPFQLFLASTYGGAFHPTAEGQARMADDVLKAARKSLSVGN
jgi:hypothetical protein